MQSANFGAFYLRKYGNSRFIISTIENQWLPIFRWLWLNLTKSDTLLINFWSFDRLFGKLCPDRDQLSTQQNLGCQLSLRFTWQGNSWYIWVLHELKLTSLYWLALIKLLIIKSSFFWDWLESISFRKSHSIIYSQRKWPDKPRRAQKKTAYTCY